MKLAWLIDTDLIGEEQPNLSEHIKKLGYSVYKLTATRDLPIIQYEPDCVYAFLGSFQELRHVQKHYKFPVATYGLNKYMNRSGYISYMPNSWFLNDASIMTTWGQFKHDSNRFFNLYDADSLFIRPDNGTKTFTGQVIRRVNIMEQIQFLEKYSSVANETLIWVGDEKNIDREYRFWISAGKVVTWSEYNWDKSHVTNIDPPTKIIIDMAEQVAKYSWQVDRIYTVDITEYLGFAKIIELNSFSCAGLYNCDSGYLLEIVSQDILDEWEHE